MPVNSTGNITPGSGARRAPRTSNGPKAPRLTGRLRPLGPPEGVAASAGHQGVVSAGPPAGAAAAAADAKSGSTGFPACADFRHSLERLCYQLQELRQVPKLQWDLPICKALPCSMKVTDNLSRNYH